MIKRFCDICGDEMTSINSPKGGALDGNRLGVSLKNKEGTVMKVELLTSKDGVANDGDFCKYCILNAIQDLDDRPRLVK